MLRKLTTIWKNRKLIWQGFINKIFKKDPIEKLFNERIEICNGCPMLDVIGTDCLVEGTQPCCAVCGCSLSMKLRSPDSECPHPDGPKWKSISTQNSTQDVSNISSRESQVPESGS